MKDYIGYEVDNAELIEDFKKFEKGKQVNILTKPNYFEAHFDMHEETENVYITGQFLIIRLAFRDTLRDSKQYFESRVAIDLLNGKCYKKASYDFLDSRTYVLVKPDGKEIRFEFAINMLNVVQSND